MLSNWLDRVRIFHYGVEDDVAEGKMEEVMTAIKNKYFVTDTENYKEAKVKSYN